MKIFLVICIVAIVIAGFYYLVKSLVIVGLLTVIGIGIGLYFWINKKLKSWLIRIFSKEYSNRLTARKNHYTHARGQNFCANFVPLAYKIRPYCGISPNIFYLLSYWFYYPYLLQSIPVYPVHLSSNQ